ncbi:leucine-rich repeat-containing protein 23-like [Daktulosphaira vitifoliae]|uniref:leucine-rich repeat-containing protein 23-like n=1 Tax=Daktulosphaira vitifoliae TaxID=58002 RepID=UPI0021AAD77A|nr:leucine-rich repeat-containing protein 23-like [Daktulosphaira vitifoliae]
MPYLKVLTLNSNKVSSLSGLKQSSLKCLSLNDNNISQLICESDNNSSFKDNYFNGIDCPELMALSICSNNLININNISQVSINLSVLYLSRNKIQNLKGLKDLINLERLHLRSNHITKLDGFNEKMKKLKYLNIRENRIDNIKELKKLKCLSSLKILVVKSNNFNDNNENTNNRMNILNMLPWLKRLDKDEVTKNEKDNIEYEETDDAYSNIEIDSSIGNEEELIFEDQDF